MIDIGVDTDIAVAYGLLHDIGKTRTAAPNKNGGISFFKHASKGAEMILNEEVKPFSVIINGERIDVSRDLIMKAAVVAEYHMDICSMKKASKIDAAKNKILDNGIDVYTFIALIKADMDGIEIPEWLLNLR